MTIFPSISIRKNSNTWHTTLRCLFELATCLISLSVFLAPAKPSTVMASEVSNSQLTDGEYAIEVSMTGGSGKAQIESPTRLIVKDGQYFAKITFSSSNYDYMLVDGVKYEKESEEDANSLFTIPIASLDEDLDVIADTLAMGTPHEINYSLHFYSKTIDSTSSLPANSAKRVLFMAFAIIIVGGIINYFLQKKRNMDYMG